MTCLLAITHRPIGRRALVVKNNLIWVNAGESVRVRKFSSSWNNNRTSPSLKPLTKFNHRPHWYGIIKYRESNWGNVFRKSALIDLHTSCASYKASRSCFWAVHNFVPIRQKNLRGTLTQISGLIWIRISIGLWSISENLHQINWLSFIASPL